MANSEQIEKVNQRFERLKEMVKQHPFQFEGNDDYALGYARGLAVALEIMTTDTPIPAEKANKNDSRYLL